MYRYNPQGARFSSRAFLAYAQTGLVQTLDVRPRAASQLA